LALGATVETLNSILGAESYLLVKTYKGYPYVTHDVDILVKDAHKAGLRLEKNGFCLRQTEQYKVDATKNRLLRVSIHERISWGSLTVLDEQIMWEGSGEVDIEGTRVKVPSPEGDLLSHFAHMAFELYFLTLGDLLYVCRLSRNAGLAAVAEQAETHSWMNSLERVVSVVNALHRCFYGCESPIEKKMPVICQVEPTLPFVYPPHYVVRAYAEKRRLSALTWELPFYFYRRVRTAMPQPITFLPSFLYVGRDGRN
jgi:hypothetical protein